MVTGPPRGYLWNMCNYKDIVSYCSVHRKAFILTATNATFRNKSISNLRFNKMINTLLCIYIKKLKSKYMSQMILKTNCY